jgi:hypothetical protein
MTEHCGCCASIMHEIAQLSAEVRQLRILIDNEVIRADDMPIMPVFQRGSWIVSPVDPTEEIPPEISSDTSSETHSTDHAPATRSTDAQSECVPQTLAFLSKVYI